jgi:hypothetical protein
MTEEVANLVTYVCSPLSAVTNGAALRVDGGVEDIRAVVQRCGLVTPLRSQAGDERRQLKRIDRLGDVRVKASLECEHPVL